MAEQVGRKTQHGYITVRVGKDHHLAHKNRWAYLHRLVAEEKLGRRLEPGEVVHHINGEKTDNRPENLAIVVGNAGHYVFHRTSGKALRLPGEENPTVACECGCGETFLRYDGAGRPRRFVTGHNTVHREVDPIRKARLDAQHQRGTERRAAAAIRRANGHLVECACGCGATFASKDAAGRERRFVSGHNWRGK